MCENCDKIMDKLNAEITMLSSAMWSQLEMMDKRIKELEETVKELEETRKK